MLPTKQPQYSQAALSAENQPLNTFNLRYMHIIFNIWSHSHYKRNLLMLLKASIPHVRPSLTCQCRRCLQSRWACPPPGSSKARGSTGCSHPAPGQGFAATALLLPLDMLQFPLLSAADLGYALQFMSSCLASLQQTSDDVREGQAISMAFIVEKCLNST